jgi:toxin ParE1/3/4
MRLRYTDTASLDLDQGISYLRDNAPEVVADFADSIDNAVAQLIENPYLAQETEEPGVRRRYIRRFKYSIFYAIEGDELVILHIHHAARRWPWQNESAATK